MRFTHRGRLPALAATFVATLMLVTAPVARAQETPPELLIRVDDIGMSHAVNSALRELISFDYLDYHMLTVVSTPGMRAVVESLASEFDLGLSRYFKEPSLSLWDVEPELKLPTILEMLGTMSARRPNLLVIHLGLETPEMNALIDANNPADPYRVARHRQAELDALTAPAFLRGADARGIRFVTYADLVERYGLDSMTAPPAFGYSMNESTDP